MQFSHTWARSQSLPNAFENVEQGKTFSWCNRNRSDSFCHLKDSLEFLIQFFFFNFFSYPTPFPFAVFTIT